jgi:hypothetical protein
MRNEISKKRMLAGWLIIMSINLFISFILPFPLSIPAQVIVSIFVLAKYWSLSMRKVILLAITLVGTGWIIALIVPFPFGLIATFIIGFIIIYSWLNR